MLSIITAPRVQKSKMVEYRFWNPRNRKKISIKKCFYLRYVYHHSIEEIGRGMKKMLLMIMMMMARTRTMRRRMMMMMMMLRRKMLRKQTMTMMMMMMITMMTRRDGWGG